jgi:general secretion pathway protein G
MNLITKISSLNLQVFGARSQAVLGVKNRERGMTLVEVLAVIVLIGLILTVVARGVTSRGNAAKAKLNELKMTKLKQSLENYQLEYNNYPGNLNDLVKQSSDNRDSGKLFTPYASPDDLKDVWGKEFQYRQENDGRSFALTSFGADGVAGGENDKQDLTMKP